MSTSLLLVAAFALSALLGIWEGAVRPLDGKAHRTVRTANGWTLRQSWAVRRIVMFIGEVAVAMLIYKSTDSWKTFYLLGALALLSAAVLQLLAFVLRRRKAARQRATR